MLFLFDFSKQQLTSNKRNYSSVARQRPRPLCSNIKSLPYPLPFHFELQFNIHSVAIKEFQFTVLWSCKVARSAAGSQWTHPMISFLYQLLLPDYAYLHSLPCFENKKQKLTCHTHLSVITVVTWKWKEMCAKSEARRRRHEKLALHNLKKLSSIKTLLKLGRSGRKRRSGRTSTYVYI